MDKIEDEYLIPTNKTEGFYKEKASKFISFLFPVKTVEDVELALESIKSIHPKARHICYAYRLTPLLQQGKPQTVAYRINDDGEPSGTAGKPIYGQIQSAQLHEVFIGVVRYFGGTKLGASGLIRAYKTAAQEVCGLAETQTKYEQITCRISFDYARMGDLMNIVKAMGLEISEKQFDLEPNMVVLLRKVICNEQINIIKAKLLHRAVEDITEDTKVENIKFELSL
ncbi:YigZ family protein [Saprospiraceae bacterium]|nr:YigZ family protein [Saprospiraceae bacterium]